MPKPILDRVTITGADDSISPEDLLGLTVDYPFVEWGILVSKKQEGSSRFPSEDWIKRLVEIKRGQPNPHPSMRLSMHVCGRWVRQLMMGDGREFSMFLAGKWCAFERIQLNFHAEPHQTVPAIDIWGGWNQDCFKGAQYIVQFDGVNEHMLHLLKNAGFDAVPLFDLSGGAGVLPEEWPKPVGNYCGYAGGLSPDNLEEQLERISQVCGGGPIWIDTETRVRSDHDRQFDLGLVRDFLEAARPWAGYECPRCGAKMQEDVVWCGLCGKPFCYACGSPPEGICGACGEKLAKETAGDNNE